MSRYEFDPITHEPFNQAPISQTRDEQGVDWSVNADVTPAIAVAKWPKARISTENPAANNSQNKSR